MLVDFQIFLDAIALVQGVVFGVLLMVLNKSKRKSCFFLGLFVLFFSLKLVHYISRSLVLQGDYSELLLLPFNFSWLIFPLFLIYTHQVSVFANRRPPYWTLLPGIMVVLIQVYIFFLPFATKLTISADPLHDFFFTYIGIYYSWIIALWNLKLLYQHRTEVSNSFSQIEAKELHWARIFLIYSLVSSLLIHILYYIAPTNIYFKILFSTFDLFTIYWTVFHGISQRNVIAVLNNQHADIGLNIKLTHQASTTGASDMAMQRLADQIDEHVITSKAYVASNLTIIDLSETLKIHPRRLSTAINSARKQNFNTYINQFRIKKAIEFLKSSDQNKYSVEGIGTEVGFNSKSAFYAAFKKVTGTTPIKYKEILVP
ncbi:MAG: AraC family transcriptional regulator [Maribacter sp.]|uniref:helix-turn-helix domain-containing protein n=1 Tax=Maribacter sp. TaxID=1897614 RepID=UPI003299D4CC